MISAFGIEHGQIAKAYTKNKGRLESALASATPGSPQHTYAQMRLLSGNAGSRVGAPTPVPSGRGGKRAKARGRDVRAYGRAENARGVQLKAAGMAGNVARDVGAGKSNMKRGLQVAAPRTTQLMQAGGGGGIPGGVARGMSRGGKIGLAAGGLGLLGAGTAGGYAATRRRTA